MPRPAGLIAAALLVAVQATLPYSTVGPAPLAGAKSWAKRAFFDTKYGQLHYLTGGEAQNGEAPLLLIHAHPRSIVEFSGVMEQIHNRTAFVAVDYFGMGASDDYVNPEDPDDFVTSEQFAVVLADLMTHLGHSSFIPMGSLKGSFVACELAYAYPSRVPRHVEILPLVLPDKVIEVMKQYITMARHPAISANGSHLAAFWAEANAKQADLYGKQVRMADEMRSIYTGWKYMMTEAQYNDLMLARQAKIATPTMLVWPLAAMEAFASLGWDVAASRKSIETALSTLKGAVTVHECDGCTEGLVWDNATAITGWLDAFLASDKPAVVV